ncbi:TadE/TadG family type IV pilus assembly protein [Vibrio campbellii]|uniref:TadE/TadG family type IV pilus assembly protein n=1 Tax=Vibrio campbellii TaxID=680 RepID=UPI000CD3564A|nr:TadE family protein [Vibrio campbellii]AUW04137.1 pilus assembly protein TadE [Vibrio campbellii]
MDSQIIQPRIRSFQKQKALAVIEFIIALPVLLMLSVLIIDVCRAFIQYTEVNKALQNGARYALVDTYGTLDFSAIADETSIKNVVVYGKPAGGGTPVIDHIEVSDITVTQPTAATKQVTLSATYDYVPIFSSMPFSGASLQFSIGASTTMRTGP